MRKSALDILACPMDKSFPLELTELTTEGDKTVEGILYCNSCGRFYPIVQEIPVMLPDELRDKAKDLDFLQKWQGRIPEKVIKQGKPWHL
jgi:uncharacterized protein YbaR (Trm112 family)